MTPLQIQGNIEKHSHIKESLMRKVAIRFNTIEKAIPDISHKVLSYTLKNLERDKQVVSEKTSGL